VSETRTEGRGCVCSVLAKDVLGTFGAEIFKKSTMMAATGGERLFGPADGHSDVQRTPRWTSTDYGAPGNTRVVPLTRDSRTANRAISIFFAAKDPGFDLDVQLPKMDVKMASAGRRARILLRR
jgi:hypothetical protein